MVRFRYADSRVTLIGMVFETKGDTDVEGNKRGAGEEVKDNWQIKREEEPLEMCSWEEGFQLV